MVLDWGPWGVWDGEQASMRRARQLSPFPNAPQCPHRLPCQCSATWRDWRACVCDGIAGNEAPVDLYVNSSGLMWENAESFGAYLIWAEHR